MTKKLCILIPSVSSGGIENYVLRVLKTISDNSKTFIVVRNSSRGELLKDYEATGANIVFMPLRYLNILRMLKLYYFFKRNRFDVICDLNANFSAIPILMGFFLKTRRRVAFYRQGQNHFKSTLLKNIFNKAMNRIVYIFSTHILFNSKVAVEYFFPYRNKQDSRFMVINNGVFLHEYETSFSKLEIRERLKIPADKFVVGHVGRLDSSKNHKIILRCFKTLSEKSNNYYLVLCGKDVVKLTSQIEHLGLSKNVLLLSYRKDVPLILKSLDCFIFPSITEGQPNALIEAMVSGLPIVASSILPIKECVDSEFWEFLVNPQDYIGMASLIEDIKNNNSDFSKLKLHAKKHFDADINFKIFKEIIDVNE